MKSIFISPLYLFMINLKLIYDHKKDVLMRQYKKE